MRRKVKALLGVTLLVLALGAIPATTIFARGDENKAVVLDVGGNQVGEARLTLKIEMKTEDLAPSHVFSIWGIINDQPAFSLNGFISDDFGKAKFDRKVKVGNHLDINQFRIVIKDHGVPLPGPGEVKLQQTTKTYGCEGSCPSVRFVTFNGS